jgi:hypothetical protein
MQSALPKANSYFGECNLLREGQYAPIRVCGELIISRYRPVSALCENRVTRLCTIVIGTAFATGALRLTVN